jgi:hypothetical protein
VSLCRRLKGRQNQRQGLITVKHIGLDDHNYLVTTYENDYRFQVQTFLCAANISTYSQRRIGLPSLSILQCACAHTHTHTEWETKLDSNLRSLWLLHCSECQTILWNKYWTLIWLQHTAIKVTHSTAARLLGLWVWILLEAWTSVSCKCCQVEVSATGWSLIQRSPTECGVSKVCDRETSKNGRHRPLRGCQATGRKKKKR